MPLEIILAHRNSLAGVAARGARLTTKRARLRIELSHLSSAEAAAWRTRLERLHNECGCGAGAAALLLAVLCCCATLLLERGGPFAANRASAALAPPLVILCTVAGKMAGLWWARTRLREAVLELCALLESREGHHATSG